MQISREHISSLPQGVGRQGGEPSVEETGTQRGKVTSPRSHGSHCQTPGLSQGLPASHTSVPWLSLEISTHGSTQNSKHVLSLGSGGLKSRVKVSQSHLPSRGSMGRVLPHLFQLQGAPALLGLWLQHSDPCRCLHRASSSSILIRTSAIGGFSSP